MIGITVNLPENSLFEAETAARISDIN